MIEFFKKYWDIICGLVISVLVAILAEFQLYKIQLCYSIIILVLVSIGFFRIIKQSRERKKTVIDNVIDGQPSVKAVNIAQNPTKDGEVLGEIVIKLWEGLKGIMKKLKVWFDKFKGIILSIALGILTVVEMYGGYIGGWCDGKLTIHGIEVVPYVTLFASVVVGIISNGWSKEQKEKIKALFSKSSTNEIVMAEIKKTLKEDEAKLKKFKGVLSTKQTELDNLNSELATQKNTHSAKVEMSVMTPRLATADDVKLAEIAVSETEKKIADKKKEIAEVETTIENLTSTIKALKSQL